MKQFLFALGLVSTLAMNNGAWAQCANLAPNIIELTVGGPLVHVVLVDKVTCTQLGPAGVMLNAPPVNLSVIASGTGFDVTALGNTGSGGNPYESVTFKISGYTNVAQQFHATTPLGTAVVTQP